MKNTIVLDRHAVEFTHQERILFPKKNISKGDLLAYYQLIAPIMLVHLRDRLLSVQRFPEGASHEGFYQKDAPDYFPKWIKRVRLKTQTDEMVDYMVCNNVATLLYLVNQNTITFHRWLSRTDKIDFPDRLIFDLDPSPHTTFAQIVSTAQLLKNRLEQDRLVPFVMTTGSKGLHVVVPLRRTAHFEKVRAYAKGVAGELVAQYPKQVTLEIRKSERGKRLFIDTLRNAYGQTGVAPYSVRATDSASIALPVEWQQLSLINSAQQFTIQTITEGFKQYIDPWKNIQSCARALPSRFL